jgi:hypothetical protein
MAAASSSDRLTPVTAKKRTLSQRSPVPSDDLQPTRVLTPILHQKNTLICLCCGIIFDCTESTFYEHDTIQFNPGSRHVDQKDGRNASMESKKQGKIVNYGKHRICEKCATGYPPCIFGMSFFVSGNTVLSQFIAPHMQSRALKLLSPDLINHMSDEPEMSVLRAELDIGEMEKHELWKCAEAAVDATRSELPCLGEVTIRTSPIVHYQSLFMADTLAGRTSVRHRGGGFSKEHVFNEASMLDDAYMPFKQECHSIMLVKAERVAFRGNFKSNHNFSIPLPFAFGHATMDINLGTYRLRERSAYNRKPFLMAVESSYGGPFPTIHLYGRKQGSITRPELSPGSRSLLCVNLMNAPTLGQRTSNVHGYVTERSLALTKQLKDIEWDEQSHGTVAEQLNSAANADSITSNPLFFKAGDDFSRLVGSICICAGNLPQRWGHSGTTAAQTNQENIADPQTTQTNEENVADLSEVISIFVRFYVCSTNVCRKQAVRTIEASTQNCRGPPQFEKPQSEKIKILPYKSG